MVLDHYAMVFAIEELKKRNYTGPVVHIAHDFETMVTRDLAASFRGTILMKLALKLNAIKTARAEKQLACASDVVATLTEFDAGEFRKIGARRTVALPPGYDGPVAEASWRKDERNLRVAIVGSFAAKTRCDQISRLRARSYPDISAFSLGPEHRENRRWL